MVAEGGDAIAPHVVDGCESETWSQVEALFDQAWEQAPDRREAWLRAQPVPAQVIDQVLDLLAAITDAGTFLESDPETTEAGDGADPYLLDAGDRAGPWRIESIIGRGGMGQVYRVQRDDGQFQQAGALKVIAAADAAGWQRFESERQILASLDHPGIARLIDGGLLPSQRPYMVMEYVQGEPIDHWCQRKDLDLRSRVRLIVETGLALAHAHGRLVVHGDIKPSNILVDGDGRPRLIDFGVARLADQEGSGLRQALSPDYAAPEQLLSHAVTTLTDVHGLAATLYRLVSNRPIRQTSGLPTAVIARRIAEGGIVPLAGTEGARRWRRRPGERRLLHDLDAILAKALAPDPGQRYRSVDAFCDELRRALEQRIVQARGHQRRYRLGRWLLRNRGPVASAAAVIVSLVLGLGAALWQGREAAHQRDDALSERARLEAIQQAILHMFRSAGETGGGEISAAQVLDTAAQRIQDQFTRDPAGGAPVLHMLGELYFLLTDYEAAAPLLARVAEADSDQVDSALVTAASYDLAQIRLRQGAIAEADELLARAQAFWQQAPNRWRRQLLESRLLEAQLLRAHGDAQAAVALLERTMDEATALGLGLNRVTGVMQNNLGVLFFGLGESDRARAAFAAAELVWSALDLQHSSDALNTLNNWGAVELAAGQLEAAEPLLRQALALRREHFGASAATAALLNNYGKLLLRLDRFQEGRPVLEEAVDMAVRYAGVGSVHHVAALAGLAEARIGLDQAQAGRELAESALALSLANLGTGHPGVGMARLALAQAHAELAEPARAAALLDEVAQQAGSDSAGQRLAEQASRLRERYRLPAARPVPGTATPSP